MKKLVLPVLVMFFVSVTPLLAQLEKGKIMVGVASTFNLGTGSGSSLMSFGYSSNKYNDSDPYKCIDLNLLPRGGYFVIDKLAVGLNVILSTWSEKSSDGEDKESSTTIGIGPFVRYYYPLEKFYPFIEIDASIGSHHDKYQSEYYDDESKSGLFSFGAGVGAAKPLGDRVTLDALLGYNHVAWKDKGEGEEDGDTQKSGGIGLIVGFTVFFGPK
jgi:hypothetical protein